jgi:chromosome partitioning protein
MDMSSQRLKNKSLALLQLKGGVGKSVLAANLAAIAAAQAQWTTVLVDLDANAPLSAGALGSLEARGGIREALNRAAAGEQVDDLLTFAPSLGAYLLSGDIRGIPNEQLRCLADLIQELLQTYVETSQGARPVDFVLVDPPGQSREINAAVLAGVDAVAVPFVASSMDFAATTVTLQMVALQRSRRSGRPAFLGLIPNRVTRRGKVERAFLDVMLESGKLLPFIPNSENLRQTFLKQSRQGAETVIGFSPRSVLARRLVALWEALNDPEHHPGRYAEEFRSYLGLEELQPSGKDISNA